MLLLYLKFVNVFTGFNFKLTHVLQHFIVSIFVDMHENARICTHMCACFVGLIFTDLRYKPWKLDPSIQLMNFPSYSNISGHYDTCLSMTNQPFLINRRFWYSMKKSALFLHKQLTDWFPTISQDDLCK